MHENAGKEIPQEALMNVPELISRYYTEKPDVRQAGQEVVFGTSGHRGSSLRISFNENHILAITQAICNYRQEQGISGPLFLGMDTHALSLPAQQTALQVLAANGIETMIAPDGLHTPTPVISHAIISYNQKRKKNLADGIVITPSHNPPQDGGFKYNGTNGGPADTTATKWIATEANRLLKAKLKGVKVVTTAAARESGHIHDYDYRRQYIADLEQIVDLQAIAASGLRIGADALGGAGWSYWIPIAEKYGLDLTLLNGVPDPTFRFMRFDHDGKIRMDCSSKFAMGGLIKLKNSYDIAFGNDPDFDRHGIVCPSVGLMNPNHFLAVAIDYLFRTRRNWSKKAAVGKTVVSSMMIDKVAAKLKRQLVEVPVGFKWFVPGLSNGTLGFGGEESAGASYLRRDGSVWSTDKDGLIMSLLAAEITAVTGKDPGLHYADLEKKFGVSCYQRRDNPCTAEQKAALAALQPDKLPVKEVAGEKILSVLTNAPGNNAPIGGLKVTTASGWFAIRPSGTENLLKIYGESMKGTKHLEAILATAESLIQG